MGCEEMKLDGWRCRIVGDGQIDFPRLDNTTGVVC
jgi:hypothetical protein